MVKSDSGTGSGQISFTNPAPARFSKSKSSTALQETHTNTAVMGHMRSSLTSALAIPSTVHTALCNWCLSCR